MPGGAVIQPASREHLGDIPGIEHAGAAMFSEEDLPAGLRYRMTAVADLSEALDDGRLWVAVLDRRTVGFALADVVDGQAYLAEIDVLPEFGRRGIGTALIRAVANWAHTSGFATLMLVTFRHLPWNAPFYAKLGFSILDAAEHGSELSGLIEEEREIGLDVTKRVAMKLRL
jgi:GNAT superfamily N-acetyltransferase